MGWIVDLREKVAVGMTEEQFQFIFGSKKAPAMCLPPERRFTTATACFRVGTE
jgi:hypothetical protein